MRLVKWSLTSSVALGLGLYAAAQAPLPDAGTLMDALRARLPEKPVLIAGQLVTTDRTTGQKTRLGVKMLFSTGSGEHTARYTLSDALGRTIEEMTLHRRESARLAVEYARGDPPVSAPPPELQTAVADSAACWLDLTLAFLWWRNGAVLGRQEVKGQACYVLDLHPPAPGAGYARVRLWVDTRLSMLLRAEGYDRTGELVRRISVKSFKKINEEWMLKDLEIEDLPRQRRTLLRVHTVEAAEAAAPAALPGAGSAPRVQPI